MKFIFTILILIFSYHSLNATTYYVAPNGHDDAPGTIESPFGTINRAATAALYDDTILVSAGIYRERVIPRNGGVTYLAEPGWKVFIKGSALWSPSWESEGSGIYWATPADTLFNDVPSDFPDNHNPFRTTLSVSPFSIKGAMEKDGDPSLHYSLGQVFVNGEWYMEMGAKRLLAHEKQWWYDGETNRIYVKFGSLEPEQQEVEITVRRRVIAPSQETGIDNITIEGFIVEHCGNQYPDRFQKTGFEQNMISGAIGIRNNNGWTIRNCMIRYAKTIGIDAIAACNSCKGPTDILIERCYIVSNGQTGIFGRRVAHSVFRDNVIMFNNQLEFGKTKPHAKSTGGFKGLAGFSNNRIEKNYFAENHAHGLWFDLNANNNTITGNIFVDNEEDAFFVELGGQGYDRNFFTSNLVLGGNHINSSLRNVDCGGMTYLHNLIIDHPAKSGENVAGFFSKTFNADRKNKGYTYTVGNFSFYNNLWLGVEVPYGHPYPDHYSAPSRFDCNVYTGSDTSRMFGIHRYCGSPWPYTTDQVAVLVDQDLGDASPGKEAMIVGDLARMTLSEWREFWKVHGTDADINSTVSATSNASYNRDTQILTLNIDFDPAAIGSIDHPHAGNDFNGIYIAQNGQALPGPFQDLKSGNSVYTVWSGIPILKEGQLPNSGVVAMSKLETMQMHQQVISNILQGESEYIFTFSVKQPEDVLVRICDLSGRDVVVLLNDKVEAGTHHLTWNRASTPAGCYILSFRSRVAEHGELFIVP